MKHLHQIRKRVDEELRKTVAVRDVLAGKPDRDRYIRYLLRIANQYAPHSPKVMAIAASRCTDHHPELASYLFRHAAEEQPHNDWARDDLRELGVPKSQIEAARPVHSCAALIALTYYTAAYANPMGLFGWMYVLEAVGNDLGSAAAKQLRQGLRLSKSGVQFVAGHGVADRAHTRQIEEQIQQHIRGADFREVCFVAEVVGDLYVRMFQEIDGEAET